MRTLPPLIAVVPPPLAVSEASALVAPTAPPSVVAPLVVSVSERAVASESTVLASVIAPPIVLVRVASAPRVTASL
ncbi:MAG: hypothetical protein LC648_04795 [Novosphingobium sp.]|nr:hypothetical protein [Novosphingobium sp.]